MRQESRQGASPEARVKAIRDTFDRYIERWKEIVEESQLDMQCLSMAGPWPEAERTARSTAGQVRPCQPAKAPAEGRSC